MLMPVPVPRIVDWTVSDLTMRRQALILNSGNQLGQHPRFGVPGVVWFVAGGARRADVVG